MRAFAITGIETASMISSTFVASAMRATPPSLRMSAGTRSSAMTATAPASSAIFAWSAVVTSMMTPPLSISARPRLTLNVPFSATRSRIRDGRVVPAENFRSHRVRFVQALLQLERADAVAKGGLVAGVNPVGQRLDQRQQRRVRAHERRAVRGVVERQLGVLADLRQGCIGHREGSRPAMTGQLHGADHERMGPTCGERDDQ